MRRLNLSLVICIVLCIPVVASAQKVTTTQRQLNVAEQEVRRFFESYAEDLRNHRREAIADRYDRRGTYFMGNGRKTLETFEAVKNRYLTKWNGPKSFQWHDLSFEVLSPNIAVVLGRFEWKTTDDKTFTLSYTGVLIKRHGQWRIRVEDESGK